MPRKRSNPAPVGKMPTGETFTLPEPEARKLPAVPYGTYLSVCGRRPEAMAGFNHFIKSSRLERTFKTIPEWEAAYAEFMARPTW